MQVSERDVGDLARLKLLTRREADAEQRDRLRAAQLAIEGVQTAEIQRRLDRSRGFVQRWVYAYRDGGIYPLLKRLGYSCLGFPLCPICHPCDRLNTLTTPPPESVSGGTLGTPGRTQRACTSVNADSYNPVVAASPSPYSLDGVA